MARRSAVADTDINPDQHEIDSETSNELDGLLDAAGIKDAATEAAAPPVAAATPPVETEKPAAETPETTSQALAKELVMEIPGRNLPAEEKKPEAATPPVEGAKPEAATPPVVPPTPVETKATAQGQDKELENLDLDGPPPASISQKGAANFRNLQAATKMWKGRSEDKERELLQVKEALAKAEKSGLTESIQKELDEARKFRNLFDTEHSPEFKTEFTDKVTEMEETIYRILKNHGLPAEVEEKMRATGFDQMNYDWLNKSLLDKLPQVDRDRILRRMTDRADLMDSRQTFLENKAAERAEFLKNQGTSDKESLTKYNQDIQAHVELMTKDIDWAKPKEIPANATAAERKAIEAHNSQAATYETLFNEALWPETAQARAEVAASAVASVVLSGQVQALTQARQADAEAFKVRESALLKEIEGLKSAGVLPGGDTTTERETDTSRKASTALDMDSDAGFEANAAGIL